MSSSSAATKTHRKSAATAKAEPVSELSADAAKLAGVLEQALASGNADGLSKEALQALMAACCKTYAAQVEAGHDVLPFGQRSGVSPTDVMLTASGLLRAVNLAVFELGMWQSWTGR